MATLESNKVHKALVGKMRVKPDNSTPDVYYVVYNNQGVAVASTSMSHGAKQTLGPKRVSEMARQLCLGSARELVDLVQCTLNRDQALTIMQTNCPQRMPRVRPQSSHRGRRH